MDDQSPGLDRSNSPQIISFEAILPPAMARRAEESGFKRIAMDPLKLFVLSMLAGAFISFGAIFATTVSAGSISVTAADGAVSFSAGLPYGVVRLLAGLAFSLGLILVVVGGAELFTGNNLIVMAWADGRVSTAGLVENWVVVYLGNFVGALATAALVYVSGQYAFGGGAVGAAALATAGAKM